MTSTPYWAARCIISLRIRAMVHLLTYLLTYTVGSESIKAAISETVEDKAKVTVNDLYKQVVHGLSIAGPPKCMTLNELCARFKVIDSLNAAKMTKYSLVMTPTPCIEWLDALYLLGVRRHSCTYLLTYLLTQLTRAYETGNISETVEDRAKVTINGLYKKS